MTVRWPDEILKAQNVAFDIAPRTLAAPSSVSGVTQVVASDAGIWKVSFGAVNVRNREQVLAFRAMATMLEGRLVPVLVPRCRAYQPSGSEGAGVAAAAVLLGEALVPHSDETLFSDDTPYASGINSITLDTSLPARAVAGTATIHNGGPLLPGQDFSIGERMYRLRTVTMVGATTAQLTWRPPLREAAAAGASLDFDDPVVRCRLATDTEMDLELALHRFGSPSIMFLEDV